MKIEDSALTAGEFAWHLPTKGLDVECMPWHFTEKDKIKFSGQERVPVLIDGITLFQTHGK